MNLLGWPARLSVGFAAALTIGAFVGAESPRFQQRTSQGVFGTATISGRVVDPEQTPLAGVRVLLRNDTARPAVRETFTDITGQYAFPRIPTGTYRIDASLPPFLLTQYGQKKPDRNGTPVAVGENETRGDLTIKMFRGAAIAGRVTGQSGQDLAGVTVQAFRLRYSFDGRFLEQAGAATTDDRGQYRLFGLSPAEYAVRAVPVTTFPDSPAGAVLLDGIQPPRLIGYARMFYPASTSAGQAALIRLDAGEERLGTNLSLDLVPFAVIRGRLVATTGPVTDAQFRIVDDSGLLRGGAGDSLISAVGTDGRFVLTNVPVGPFAIQVRSNIHAPGDTEGRDRPVGALWGTVRLALDRDGVSDLTVTMKPGATVSGAIKFEGTSPPLDFSAPQGTGVVVVPTGPTPLSKNEILTGRVAADGTFSIGGVPDGAYHIDVITPRLPWALGTTVVGGKDVTLGSMEVSGTDVNDVRITLADRSASLSGLVTAPAGSVVADYTIAAFPADLTLRESHLWAVYVVKPATDWRFSLSRIFPGEYLIAVTDDIETNSWFDPRVLAQLAVGAVRVKIEVGEKKVQNLRIDGR